MRMFKVVVCCVMAACGPTWAITDQERAILHRLDNELIVLHRLLDEAKGARRASDRTHVNYDQLQADLHAIQQGVRDAVNAERREARDLPPIQGAYH